MESTSTGGKAEDDSDITVTEPTPQQDPLASDSSSGDGRQEPASRQGPPQLDGIGSDDDNTGQLLGKGGDIKDVEAGPPSQRDSPQSHEAKDDNEEQQEAVRLCDLGTSFLVDGVHIIQHACMLLCIARCLNMPVVQLHQEITKLVFTDF